MFATLRCLDQHDPTLVIWALLVCLASMAVGVHAYHRGATAAGPGVFFGAMAVLGVAAGSVKSLADDLRATSTKLDSLLDKASNGRGTTGRLMNDAGLYDDMRKSLQRIDSLMADFQKNPRKYIKLSIF